MRRRRLPRLYELVIGTVEEIEDHGAFVTLDEYGGIEAYVPLNEVSHSWFKSIREVIKVGQKRVFKVIRVDPRRGLVDVSLKRVSDGERKSKLQEWKRYQRAVKLLELAAKRLGRRPEEAMREAGWKLEDAYGEMLAGFEAAVREGKEALVRAGISEPWASMLYKLAKAYVRIPKVRVSGIFTVACLQGDGVERLRYILSSWSEVRSKYPEVEARFYVVGPPRYKIDVEAYDYKAAEGFLNEVVKRILSRAEEKGCRASFERIKG